VRVRAAPICECCDIDTFAMDNSGTVKEGVGRSYTGVNGYCPLAAYLSSHTVPGAGAAPWGTALGLRTQFNLERVLPMAQRLSAAGPKAPMLLRKDAGFDGAELMRQIESYNRSGLTRVCRARQIRSGHALDESRRIRFDGGKHRCLAASRSGAHKATKCLACLSAMRWRDGPAFMCTATRSRRNVCFSLLPE